MISSGAMARSASCQGLDGRLLAALALGGLALGCSGSGGRDAGPAVTDAGPIDLCSARYAVARRRPELELLVDRSCAMTNHFDDGPGAGLADPETRWNALRAALEALPSLGVSGVGLVLSPDGAECSVPDARVAPGGGSVAEAIAALDTIAADLFDGCAAGPVGFGLEPGLNTLVVSDTVGASGDPFTIVVMGGAPACGETAGSLTAVASDVGTDIVVVTLGVDDATATLVESVGLRNSAPRPADLAAVLDEIVRSRVSCVLDIVEGSPDPDMLRVWVDGTLVPPDPDEGWSFSLGDNSITLNGSLCASLTAGTVRQVSAGVGCDEPRCVPRPERCDGLDEDCDGTVDNDCS